MTLVVCRLSVDEKNIFIHSDSRITETFSANKKLERELDHYHPLNGVLKTIMIHRHISISFAGNMDYANLVIEAATSSPNGWVYGDLIKMLFKTHLRSGNSTDFIVAIKFKNYCSITRIVNGKIEHNLNNAYIGDKAAFAKYQKYFSEAQKQTDLNKRIDFAFKAVLNDSSIKSVGDFHITVGLDYNQIPNEAVFMYGLKVEMNIALQKLSLEPGQSRPLGLGSVQDGSNIVTHFRTMTPYFHGVGIHFIQGRKGIFYCPQISPTNGILIKDVSSLEFINYIKDHYDVPMQGLVGHGTTAMKFVNTINGVISEQI